MVETDINYLSNISLGKIQNWRMTKESAITPIPFPGKDSGMTEGVDTLGVIKYISFDGRWTGDFEIIQNRIWIIQNIIDGFQTGNSVLISPFMSSTQYLKDSEDKLVAFRKQGHIGMNTSAASNTLADNQAHFDTWNITKGSTGSPKDKVKNLITGEVANVTDVVSGQVLGLDADIFTTFPVPYAVTASINVRLLKFETRWELPGLSYCDYTLEVMQVK